MRALILAGGVVFGLLAMPAASQAREYPWCAQYSLSNYNCGFTTFRQCLDTIAGVGGYCRQNPRYTAPGRPRERRTF